jgi:hypothetical protein
MVDCIVGFVSVGKFNRIPPIPPQIDYFDYFVGFVSVGKFNRKYCSVSSSGCLTIHPN